MIISHYNKLMEIEITLSKEFIRDWCKRYYGAETSDEERTALEYELLGEVQKQIEEKG